MDIPIDSPQPPKKEPKKIKTNRTPTFRSHMMENWGRVFPRMDRSLSLPHDSKFEEKSKSSFFT